MRFRSRLILASLSLMMVPAPGLAQSDTTASYDASSLRLDSRYGTFRIVRGANGAVVASVGAFRTARLEKLVGSSENAVREAREFERNQLPGAIAATIGALIMGVSIGVASQNEASWGLVAANAAGAGLLIYGGIRLNRAFSALSKSLWWYNRDLKR